MEFWLQQECRRKNNCCNNKKLKFTNFDDVANDLTILSVAESLKLIKTNLQNLGIVHNKFSSETEIVNNNEVEKAIDKLKNKNYDDVIENMSFFVSL